jgi:hypothetical protein
MRPFALAWWFVNLQWTGWVGLAKERKSMSKIKIRKMIKSKSKRKSMSRIASSRNQKHDSDRVTPRMKS